MTFTSLENHGVHGELARQHDAIHIETESTSLTLHDLIVSKFSMTAMMVVMTSAVALMGPPLEVKLPDEKPQQLPTWVVVLFMIHQTASCIAHTCLLIGAYEKRPALLYGAYIALTVLSIALVILVERRLTTSYKHKIPILMCLLAVELLQAYLILCIRSYHRRLLRDQAMPDTSATSIETQL